MGTMAVTIKAVQKKIKDANDQPLKIPFKTPMKIVKTQFLGQMKTLLAALLMTIFFSGCYSYKNQILFQGLNDTTYPASMTQTKPVIQLGDHWGYLFMGSTKKPLPTSICLWAVPKAVECK